VQEESVDDACQQAALAINGSVNVLKAIFPVFKGMSINTLICINSENHRHRVVCLPTGWQLIIKFQEPLQLLPSISL
jgi:hypothetical protein